MTYGNFRLKYLAHKENFASFCLILGSQNLLFISLMLLISALCFFLKLPVSSFIVIFALIISTAWCWWISGRYFKDNDQKHGVIFIYLLAIFCISLFSCIAISGHFFDLSWDGQTYHQETVNQLANGWNPFYEEIPSEISGSMWINHYAKGAEINSAALLKVTGDVEKCKAINFLLMMTTFLISCATIIIISDFTKLSLALVLGFLISMNPVSICQSLNFYVDGQLASVASCLLCLILLLSKRADILVLISLISAVIILINIKSLGLIYALIFSLGLLSWIFIYKKEKLFLISKCLLLSFVVGSLVVGFNPYVTNIIDHGNPLYPTLGSNIDIMTCNKPVSFQNINPIENLFSSIFSHPDAGVGVAQFKMPFTFYHDDFEAFRSADVRISGFGPMFSGAIVLALLNLFAILALKKRDVLKDPNISIKLLVFVLILISVFVNPESWWARYVPQLWLIPIFSLFFLFNIKTNLLNYISYILILILFINVIMISSVYLNYQISGTETLNEQLDYLSSLHDKEIKINFNEFISNKIRLTERGVKYEEVQQLNFPPSFKLFNSDTQIYITQIKFT
jgi:hypothetical protein